MTHADNTVKALETERYKCMQDVMKIAKTLLKEDGSHMPILFMFHKDKNYVIPMEFTEDNKMEQMRKMRLAAKKTGARACLLITEAWVASFESDETSYEQAFIEGQVPVRDHPNKREALSMSWEIKLDNEIIKGVELLHFHRDNDGTVITDKTVRSIDSFQGNMIGILS